MVMYCNYAQIWKRTNFQDYNYHTYSCTCTCNTITHPLQSTTQYYTTVISRLPLKTLYKDQEQCTLPQMAEETS